MHIKKNDRRRGGVRPAVLGILLLAVCGQVRAQVLLENTSSRNTTSLNGAWRYIIDPYETGYLSFHAQVYDEKNPGAASAFYNNYHAKDKQELVEYDFDKSPEMMIPGSWNIRQPQLLYYEGTIWFRKTFDHPLREGRRQFIYFGAVNYRADVYLNGKKLGIHEGGFTPFCFEVTGVIKATGNYLVVKADNRRLKTAVPALNTDWWNHGGITRDVLLIDEPEVLIQDYSIHLQKDGRTIAGYVRLNGATGAEKVTITIPRLGMRQELMVTGNEKGVFQWTGEQPIRYWSPEKPVLYPVIIKTTGQELHDETGFRTIEVSGAKIKLNGKPVFLKGISMHEEINGRRACTEADARQLLGIAKQLGCNFVRLAHYPHNEQIVRMADKMGLMVWEEVPVYWTIDFFSPEVLTNAMNQVTAMIERDKNRPAVIIWSVANETPQSEQRNSFLGALIHHARQLDSTRLVSAALLTRQENGVGIIDDSIGHSLDIVSFNQYRGWYGGDLATAPNARWTTPFNKPVVVSEFGGDAKQGFHGPKDHRWTEEYQEYLYRQNLLMIEKMPHISGISPWILMDFRSPRRTLPGIQDGFNRKGLVSEKGVKKKAFFVLRDFYKGK